MTIELSFPRPLPREERTRILLAVAGLAAAKRVDFARNGYGATISGEALSLATVSRLLREAGVRLEGIRSSLQDSEAGAQEAPGEAFTPPGRGGGPSRT